MSAPCLADPPVLALGELRRVVCETASRFDAAGLDRDGAAAAVADWSAIGHAAAAGLALAAARVQECGPPPSAGARDTADYLAKQTGTSTAKAKDTISHGRRLSSSSSSRTRKAAAGGTLSPEQAAAISDAVALNPGAEARLLAEASRSSLGELRQACARAKAEVQDLQAIEARIHAKRSLRRWRDAEGVEHLHASGPKPDLSMIDQALKDLIDEQFDNARRNGIREGFEAYSFDALVELARRHLDRDRRGGDGAGESDGVGGGASDGTDDSDRSGDGSDSGRGGASDGGGRPGGGSDDGGGRPGEGRGGRPGGDTPGGDTPGGGAALAKRRDPIRYLAVLRLDLTALLRGHSEAGETCEIAGLGPISVPAAREMLGEAVLKIVLTDGIEVRNVTHLGRGPTTAQKIALLWQQPLCTRRGCGRRARLEYDHREDWARTRHTILDELDPLCHPDHQLKTLHDWALVEGTGTRDMVPPGHPLHPDNTRSRRGTRGRAEQERGP